MAPSFLPAAAHNRVITSHLGNSLSGSPGALDECTAGALGLEPIIIRRQDNREERIYVFEQFTAYSVCQNDEFKSITRSGKYMVQLENNSCWLDVSIKLLYHIAMGTRNYDYVPIEKLTDLHESGVVDELFIMTRVLLTDTNWANAVALREMKNDIRELVYAVDQAGSKELESLGNTVETYTGWDILTRDQPCVSYTAIEVTECRDCKNRVIHGKPKRLSRALFETALCAESDSRTAAQMLTATFAPYKGGNDGSCRKCKRGQLYRRLAILDRLPHYLYLYLAGRLQNSPLSPSEQIMPNTLWLEFLKYDCDTETFVLFQQKVTPAAIVVRKFGHFEVALRCHTREGKDTIQRDGKHIMRGDSEWIYANSGDASAKLRQWRTISQALEINKGAQIIAVVYKAILNGAKAVA